MVFAENLKKHRENLGYSVKDMAGLLKVKYTTYVSWENGKEPKYHMLVYIADMLNISIDMLLKDYDRQKDDLFTKIAILLKRAEIRFTVKRDDQNIIQYLDIYTANRRDENVTVYRLSEDEFIELGTMFLNQSNSFEIAFIKSLTETLFMSLELLAKAKQMTHIKPY